jgi:CheY-like chemotaxis protein
VQQSGGHVAVYSEPGRGTTFKVYLPRTEQVGTTFPTPVVADVPHTGSETVVLVEDDSSLRAAIRDLLREGGYTVIEGPSPEASLAAAEAHAGPIHLLLTDLVMPQMSGREATARLRATRPGVKVLYMSGYANTAAEHNGGLPEHEAFLQKPFSLGALLRKLREVLDLPE